MNTTPSSTPDQASERLCRWLAAVAQGDQQALRAVIQATGERLLSEAERLLKTRECAEEVLQDTWVRVWNAAASYDPGVARPMTWLLRIVQNRAIDLLRAQRRQRECTVELDDTVIAMVAEPGPGPEAQLLARSEQAALSRALRVLSHEQRMAMSLMLHRGFSHPEIAASCQVPESTARTWVRRGLRRLLAADHPTGRLQASNDALAQAA